MTANVTGPGKRLSGGADVQHTAMDETIHQLRSRRSPARSESGFAVGEHRIGSDAFLAQLFGRPDADLLDWLPKAVSRSEFLGSIGLGGVSMRPSAPELGGLEPPGMRTGHPRPRDIRRGSRSLCSTQARSSRPPPPCGCRPHRSCPFRGSPHGFGRVERDR